MGIREIIFVLGVVFSGAACESRPEDSKSASSIHTSAEIDNINLSHGNNAESADHAIFLDAKITSIDGNNVWCTYGGLRLHVVKNGTFAADAQVGDTIVVQIR